MLNHPFLSIHGLSKSYAEGDQRHVVLDKLDLDIDKGEFVALLGASGSGKSTLLNLISGIDDADIGSIRVADQELLSLNENERTLFRRRYIGFVFQFFNLLPTLTVLENITLPLELSGTKFHPAREKALGLLESVGLAGRGDSYPDRLSGGEQQRVAIARALIHDPLLVLADEPTGNLDEETGDKVMSLLIEMTRSTGRNLLMATHSLENARLADRVLSLHEGRLFED